MECYLLSGVDVSSVLMFVAQKAGSSGFQVGEDVGTSFMKSGRAARSLWAPSCPALFELLIYF